MSTMKSNKKELSPKQREELLSALKDRFEKNLNRHKVWIGPRCRPGWKPMRKNCGRSQNSKRISF
jgi:hypothetical protein